MMDRLATTATCSRPLRLRLGPSSSAASLVVRAIVFDMDGTLTQPLLNFALMKQRLSLAPTADIVHHLHSLPAGSLEHTRATAIVREMEHQAMLDMTLARGFHPLLSALTRVGVPKAILTRNHWDPVHYLLQNHAMAYAFNPIVTRDCVVPSKPAPDPLLHIAHGVWQVDPARVLMVGDGVDDMLCAHAAGALSCWVNTRANVGGLDTLRQAGVHPHVAVNGLHDLLALLDVVDDDESQAACVGATPLSKWAQLDGEEDKGSSAQ